MASLVATSGITFPTLTADSLVYTNTSKIAASVTLGANLSLTSGTLAVTGGNLTKGDDTNVTLTLGGTPTGSLLNSVSITAGWTGTLAATRGGTGTGTYTVGDILYASTTSVLSKLSAGTSGHVLTSNGAGVAPSWQAAAGGGGAISALTAATATNDINNAAYQQDWRWNSLAGGSGLKLSSTSTAATGNTQKLFEVDLSGANATSSQTTYAGYFSNTHTGTSSTNVAGYFSASGGTNNYAIDVGAGKVRLAASTTAGASLNIPVGTAPTSPVDGDVFMPSASSRQTRLNGTTYHDMFIASPVVSRVPYFLAGTTGIVTSSADFQFTGTTLLLGGTSATANTRLDVRGTGTGTNKTFRTADSGNTERFVIQDNGVVGIVSSSTDALTITPSANNRGLFMASSGGAGTIGSYFQHSGAAGDYIANRFQNLSSNLAATTLLNFRNNSNNELNIFLRSTGATAANAGVISTSAGPLIFSPFSELRISTAPANDDALTQVLVRDGSTGAIKYRTASSLGIGTSGELTALTGNAWFTQAGFNLTFLNGYAAFGSASESTVRNVEMLQRNLTVGLASTTVTTSSIIELSKNGGSTIGAGTAVADTHILGKIHFSGYDGNSQEPTARIHAVVNGSVSDGVVPTDLVFSTSSTDGASIAERFRISSTGVFSTPEGTLGKVYLATGSTSGSAFYGCGSTPITVIAAPGAGKYIHIHNITVSMTYNSVAYDFGVGEEPIFEFSGASDGGYKIPLTYINGTSSFNRSVHAFVVNSTDIETLNAPTNTAVVLTTTAGTDGTAGNSTFKYKIYYTIESV